VGGVVVVGVVGQAGVGRMERMVVRVVVME